MTPTQHDAFVEIRRLLAEAYADYFARCNDGHKSSEGAIQLHYPSIFDDLPPLEVSGISIYSYVLGPSRMHDWFRGKGLSSYACKWVGDADPIQGALEDVRGWHAQQMAYQPHENDDLFSA